MPDLFADFNGLPDKEALTEFYQHDANWSNRMILGDSLSVMASLAEREGLRGKVQCIYIDPPYGIRFNSNFQWSTTRRDVKDGNKDHITREPEQVKAFRDTWRDGIHSYLNLSARPPDRRPRPPRRQRLDLRADRRRKRPPCAGIDGRGVWGSEHGLHDIIQEDVRKQFSLSGKHFRSHALVCPRS
jgi:hypothetical protein